MKNKARLFALPFTIIIVIAMLFSIACAPKAEVSFPSTPEPTVSATAGTDCHANTDCKSGCLPQRLYSAKRRWLNSISSFRTF